MGKNQESLKEQRVQAFMKKIAVRKPCLQVWFKYISQIIRLLVQLDEIILKYQRNVLLACRVMDGVVC